MYYRHRLGVERLPSERDERRISPVGRRFTGSDDLATPDVVSPYGGKDVGFRKRSVWQGGVGPALKQDLDKAQPRDQPSRAGFATNASERWKPLKDLRNFLIRQARDNDFLYLRLPSRCDRFLCRCASIFACHRDDPEAGSGSRTRNVRQELGLSLKHGLRSIDNDKSGIGYGRPAKYTRKVRAE